MSILEFIEKYKEMYSNREYNNKLDKKNGLELHFKSKGEISFYVTYTDSQTIMSYPSRVLKLDDEDLKYLYDKYSKKLEEELRDSKEQLNSKYEKHLE